jgi:quinol monooxygenase YgiN
MRQVMVRYKVKPDRVEENEELVRAVYEELDRVDPGGLRYVTYRLDDGVTFVHLATVEDGESPLQRLDAFQRFQADIRDRCDEPPAATEAHRVGSYRL